MVFEQIEKLKQEYTDKYVVVDSNRPELLRFQNLTGIIKTVNMNGRALVQFDARENLGWYDIELDYLKVVDKPEPPVAAERPAPKVTEKEKPTAKNKPSPKAPTAPKGASVADILAAARGQKPDAAAGAPPESAPQKTAKPKPKPGQMSVADILAAARGQKPDATPPDAAAAPPAAPASDPPPQPPTSSSKAPRTRPKDGDSPAHGR